MSAASLLSPTTGQILNQYLPSNPTISSITLTDGTNVGVIDETATGSLLIDNSAVASGGTIALVPGSGAGVLISTDPTGPANTLGLAISRNDIPGCCANLVLGNDQALIFRGTQASEFRVEQDGTSAPGVNPPSLSIANNNDVKYQWFNSDATAGGLTQDNLELFRYDATDPVPILNVLSVTPSGSVFINSESLNVAQNLFANALCFQSGSPELGSGTLVGGFLVVNYPPIKASDRIVVQHKNFGGTPGVLCISSIIAGTSFTIASSSALDTSLVEWIIFPVG